LILFCDTSALVKLYIAEDASREMQALADAAESFQQRESFRYFQSMQFQILLTTDPTPCVPQA
jgi:hypothetical protein